MAARRPVRREDALVHERLAAHPMCLPRSSITIDAGPVHPRPSSVQWVLARALGAAPNDSESVIPNDDATS